MRQTWPPWRSNQAGLETRRRARTTGTGTRVIDATPVARRCTVGNPRNAASQPSPVNTRSKPSARSGARRRERVQQVVGLAHRLAVDVGELGEAVADHRRRDRDPRVVGPQRTGHDVHVALLERTVLEAERVRVHAMAEADEQGGHQRRIEATQEHRVLTLAPGTRLDRGEQQLGELLRPVGGIGVVREHRRGGGGDRVGLPVGERGHRARREGPHALEHARAVGDESVGQQEVLTTTVDAPTRAEHGRVRRERNGIAVVATPHAVRPGGHRAGEHPPTRVGDEHHDVATETIEERGTEAAPPVGERACGIGGGDPEPQRAGTEYDDREVGGDVRAHRGAGAVQDRQRRAASRRCRSGASGDRRRGRRRGKQRSRPAAPPVLTLLRAARRSHPAGRKGC